MIEWLLRRGEHYLALLLIKDKTLHVLMCGCEDR